MEIKEIPWSKPDVGLSEKVAVDTVLSSGWVTMGEQTYKFQEELAQRIGCDHVVVFDHGTSAVLAAILANGAHHLVLPDYNFPGVWNMLDTMNLEYTTLDVDPKTVHMKPRPLNYRCIYMPVSFAGLPLPEDDWGELPVIEDACEAFGARTHRAEVGNQGWTTCFSFHAAKLISMGEGGAVATNNDETAQKLVEIRNRGGLNLKPTDLQSAMGRVQLKKLDSYLENRFRASVVYEKKLDGLVEFQEIPDHCERHANMMMPVFVDEPRKLAEALATFGIETRTGWEPAAGLNGAREVARRIICLPIYNTMTVEEAEYVAECVRGVLE